MTSDLDLGWTDERPLADLPLAMHLPPLDRLPAVARLREVLEACGVAVAEDIARLGCTGLFDHGHDLPTIQFVRRNLAGSGVGLTCFVPPTRYCLGHDTIGGLQEGQACAYESSVEGISRPLTKEEAEHMGIVERVRRRKGHESLDRRLHEAMEALNPDADTTLSTSPAPLSKVPSHVKAQRAFTCEEHAEPFWGCRFCLAQAIVEGDVSPRCLLTWDDGENFENVDASEIEGRLAAFDENGVSAAAVYVRVLRFVRRLARVL